MSVQLVGPGKYERGILKVSQRQCGLNTDLLRLFQEALVLAERDGVAGRDVTPFVLSRVAELTGGKSVDANLALIEESVAQLSEKLSYRVTLLQI